MHIKYCRLFAEMFRYKAVGKDGPAAELFDRFCREVGKDEAQFELYYDHLIYTSSLMRVMKMTKSNLSDLVTL